MIDYKEKYQGLIDRQELDDIKNKLTSCLSDIQIDTSNDLGMPTYIYALELFRLIKEGKISYVN